MVYVGILFPWSCEGQINTQVIPTGQSGYALDSSAKM